MARGPSIDRSGSKQNVGTPMIFVIACEAHFRCRFTMDLAADSYNTKVPKSFFTKEDNSLIQEWPRRGTNWLNPTYHNIPDWVDKARREAAKGADTIMLVPASVGSNWFVNHVHNKLEVTFLNGRIVFDGETQPYPKDCMVIRFSTKVAAGYKVWKWMHDVPEHMKVWPHVSRSYNQAVSLTSGRRRRTMSLWD